MGLDEIAQGKEGEDKKSGPRTLSGQVEEKVEQTENDLWSRTIRKV